MLHAAGIAHNRLVTVFEDAKDKRRKYQLTGHVDIDEHENVVFFGFTKATLNLRYSEGDGGSSSKASVLLKIDNGFDKSSHNEQELINTFLKRYWSIQKELDDMLL